jgi:uncharacterized protein YcnI
MRYLIVIAVLGVALAGARAAQAHVTVHPNMQPAGAFTTLVVRVPNETADADTTKVDVQLPPGFVSVSTAPVPGWTAQLVERKLATPVTVEGEKKTSEVGEVIWSGGKIAPGEYFEFPLSVAMPDKPGTTLTFKALQSYSDGKVVRWIGAPGSDEPAPQIRLTAADSAVEDVPAGVDAAAASSSSDDGSSTKTNVALGLGIAGLAVGLVALGLVLVRRR